MEPDDVCNDLFSADDGGDDRYRTCPQCGRDCEPSPMVTDQGMKIAFVCSLHGIHTVVDLFEGQR